MLVDRFGLGGRVAYCGEAYATVLDVVKPGAINSRFEPCSVERHPGSLSDFDGAVYPLLVSISFDRHLLVSESAADLVLLGAPPGFRTQNLRIKSRFRAVSDRF